ncbi:MAG: TetR/AcrR family transcriptional regulator [Candidatus Edwardsbacteria bacterium]|nr:TetR/AcrR family transcriptional regulator [Candidatus Edwardsbacteria bacterium]MBU1577740.1 TetR/AcrR family transcriptional regulator [Candidatus Edwardsbacteria bacterium]MBU2463882.1 TetR/AcrR family transcriptional regulator [Candidatus Edwardsbacteria bacterium]MBU2594705.1 TetR/AcrR family transcriptional regulator [Candidatus Edwardsbacteria bacterium]
MIEHTLEKMPRKEREKLARRSEILKAARRIFAEKGLHETTLDEIAVKAELAKGTIYGHFENKDDLFFSVLEEAIGNLENVVQKTCQSDLPPPIKISELVKNMLCLFEENVDLMQLMTRNQPGVLMHQMQEKMQKNFKNLIKLVSGVLQDGIRQGLFGKIDTEKAAAAFFNLIHGNAMSSFWHQRKVNNKEDLKFLTNLYLNGISNCALKGKK